MNVFLNRTTMLSRRLRSISYINWISNFSSGLKSIPNTTTKPKANLTPNWIPNPSTLTFDEIKHGTVVVRVNVGWTSPFSIRPLLPVYCSNWMDPSSRVPVCGCVRYLVRFWPLRTADRSGHIPDVYPRRLGRGHLLDHIRLPPGIWRYFLSSLFSIPFFFREITMTFPGLSRNNNGGGAGRGGRTVGWFPKRMQIMASEE